ncbi:MAG: hypothetical protein ACI9XO_004170 [Paraglaciecola sp.]|jgi:hypothetical protein
MKNLFLSCIGLFVMACNPIDIPAENEITTNQPWNLVDLNIPVDFDFATTEEVSFKISAVDNQGNAMTNVPVKLNLQKGEELIALTSGMINTDGIFEAAVVIDKNIESVILTMPTKS